VDGEVVTNPSTPAQLLSGEDPADGDLRIESLNGTVCKVAYTGRDDFSVELEGTLRHAPLTANDDSVQALYGYLTLRYFF